MKSEDMQKLSRKVTGPVVRTRDRGAGQLRRLKNGWEARVRLGKDLRPGFALNGSLSDEEAEARCRVVGDIAQRLRRAGKSQTQEASELLRAAAEAADAQELAGVLTVVDEECAGLLVDDAPRLVPTFADVAKRWTSGELARIYPDHVRPVEGADQNAKRLGRLFEAMVSSGKLGDVPINRFSLDHAETAMRALPKVAKRPATRRQYAQLIHRVLGLAVYPLRLIAANPLPRGFMPKAGKPPAFPYLYPKEDAALLACSEVPLCFRMLWGFLAREGCRSGEAVTLRLGFELDLEHGVCRLDRNKTDDARAWMLDPAVARALALWCDRRRLKRGGLVFVDEDGSALENDKLAGKLRGHLLEAKVDRPELHAGGENRRQLRAHDLRGTFITLSLANGRTETWVQDRTGHTTSAMINRYRRAARSATELALGPLGPLNQLIPELQVGPQVGPQEPETERAEKAKLAEEHTKPKWRNRQTRRTQKTSEPAEKPPNTRNLDPEHDEVTPTETAMARPMAQVDPVERALASAIAEAAEAHRFDVLPVLVKELEARRLARQAPEVVDLDAARRKRSDRG